MEDAFKRVVSHIFNNWTALQLAVEHGMGGSNGKQLALDVRDYLVNYCIGEPRLEKEDIEDVLEDIMDQEFNTLCEDDSVKEIAHLLVGFLKLLREGNMAQFEVEYNNLPSRQQWLSTPNVQVAVEIQDEISPIPASTSNDQLMEEDPDWTQVRSRRKR